MKLKIIAFLLFLIGSSNQMNEIERSIDKGLNFLYQNQLDYGEFKTYACDEKDMLNCELDSSPFVTTFVLYSIKDINTDKKKVASEKGLKFLLQEQNANGAWNVYTSKNPKHRPPDDSDDTSVASAILTIYGLKYKENLHLFEKYKNDSGIVNLWFSESKEFTEYDCEVNSNVLFYFSLKSIHDSKICNFINDTIETGNFDCCIYCASDTGKKNTFPLFYIVSRAYKNGATCLEGSKKRVVDIILSKQNSDGSFGNPLKTAFAINTLFNYGYGCDKLVEAIDYLLKSQHENGMWDRYPFYIDRKPHFYGSEELTTAICVEALYRFKKHNK